MKNYKVIAVGDICLDIKPDPLDSFSLGDRQFWVENFTLSVGGNSANFCLGTANLGLKTKFIGCLAADPISVWLKGEMTKNNIDCTSMVTKKSIAGITFGLTHTDGTRQMITFNGANREFSPEDLDFGALSGASHLHRSGFWWSPKLMPFTPKLLKHAKETVGAQTSLDFGTDPEGWKKERIKYVHDCLEYTDILFANAGELKGVAQKTSLKNAAKSLLERGAGIIVCHLGNQGSAVFTKKEVVHTPAFKVVPKNPIGSGDIFNAGFVYGLSRNWSLKKTARFANACGAYYISRLQNPYPQPEEVAKQFKI